MEADPARGGRRKVDILGMMVSVVGSKEQLVNEHRIMLAEKLLNKSDYDIDSDIRTLELLKVIGLCLPCLLQKLSLMISKICVDTNLDSFWREQHAEMRNNAQ